MADPRKITTKQSRVFKQAIKRVLQPIDEKRPKPPKLLKPQKK